MADDQTAEPDVAIFDFSLPAEVYMGRGVRSRPGLRFKGFDTVAEAIRYVMERPRVAGEVATIECDEQRLGMTQITALYHDPNYPLPRTEAPAVQEQRPDISVPISRGPTRLRPVAAGEMLPPRRLVQDNTAPARHRYKVGAKLRMNNGGNSLARQASYCKVVFILPFEGGQLLYRVKSELESFERVVAEVDLSPA